GALRSKSSERFTANESLRAILDGTSTDPKVAALASDWRASLDALDKAGVPRGQIVHLSIFTTSDPVSELLAVAEDARALPPPTEIRARRARSSCSSSTSETGSLRGPTLGRRRSTRSRTRI